MSEAVHTTNAAPDPLTEAVTFGFWGEPLEFSYELQDHAKELSVVIKDKTSVVVREEKLGSQLAGKGQFTWDGLDASGERAPITTGYTLKMTPEWHPKIKFLQFHKPALESGDYTVKVTQTLDTGKGSDTFTNTRTFAVQGARFTLDPKLIHAFFPPAGSMGRHSDCLPHISLTRSTFPWERSAFPSDHVTEADDRFGSDDYESFVGLLLFDDSELASGAVTALKTITLKELKNSANAKFPFIELETGQLETDLVQVIDVKRKLLEKIVPLGEELNLLAHARMRVGGKEEDAETQIAVIVGNRFPEPGGESVVHLVSFENRYDGATKTFNFQDAGAEEYIRLVTLKSWRFGCPPDGLTFEEYVEQLDTGVLRIPDASEPGIAQDYLAKGFVPLAHRFRQCDQTFSWYHGPLTPCAMPKDKWFEKDADLPRFADELVEYHKSIGMFAVGYASAYELGRLLAVQDSVFSTALYKVKHAHNQRVCLEVQHIQNPLMGSPPPLDGSTDELLSTLQVACADLSLCKKVPFDYLVADARMLPPESIRFFKLDTQWIACLLYGAASVGGEVRKVSEDDTTRLEFFDRITNKVYAKERSGFLVRSELISGWPDIQVNAYPQAHDDDSPFPADFPAPLPMLRMERLAPDVLFCLFEGEAKMAELYLKPEGLHFGLDVEEKGLSKDVEIRELGYASVTIPARFKPGLERERVLDTTHLADGMQRVSCKLEKLKAEGRTLTEALFNQPLTAEEEKEMEENVERRSITAARFGMQMLEGSNKGRFVIG